MLLLKYFTTLGIKDINDYSWAIYYILLFIVYKNIVVLLIVVEQRQ